MAETQIKYISLANPTKYDELIKGRIDAADAKALKVVAIPGNTLNFYTEVPPLSDPAPTPAYSIEIPETDLSDINAKLATLIGDDTNKSVRTIALEELTKQLIPENAKDSLNTLQEVSAWIQSHPDEAAAMNKNITALQTLVGTIPKDATATDIVNYIKEVVKAEETRATGIEGGLRKDVDAIKGDYLKAADKTELSGLVTTEETRATEAEAALGERLTKVEAATGTVATATEDDIANLFK